MIESTFDLVSSGSAAVNTYNLDNSSDVIAMECRDFITLLNSSINSVLDGRLEFYKIDNVSKMVVMSEDGSSVTSNMESVHANMAKIERGLVALYPPHLETINLHSGNDGQNLESYVPWSLVTSRKSRRLKKKNSNIGIGGKKTTTPVSRGEVTKPAKHVAATMEGDLSNIPFKFSTEAFLVHPRRSILRKDRSSLPRATKELQHLGHFSDQPRKRKMDRGVDESC
ncbi:hypothetical protein M5K25_008356 [Dendrobium thyrsiflorum]|uniref:Uncharacterized protein n=1 Tax=Dendrobium thyrsiflorum TaxID=117978 RepID=A0ABD0VFC4_DENTH